MIEVGISIDTMNGHSLTISEWVKTTFIGKVCIYPAFKLRVKYFWLVCLQVLAD